MRSRFVPQRMAITKPQLYPTCMPTKESIEQYQRFLNERFTVFREKLAALVKAMSLEDRGKKVEAAKAAQGALEDIKRSVSQNDRPGWTGPLEAIFNHYLAQHQHNADAGHALLNAIAQQHSAIETQKWNLTEDAPGAAVDFSAIYKEYYSQSRVPALFDELVKHLEEIIHSGEVDSVKMIKALQDLIATIKKNARGDYFSTRGAWEFTRVYLKNLGIEALEKIPVLSVPIKALHKTAEELDIEMSNVTEQVSNRLSEMVHAPLPMLTYKRLALPAPIEHDSVEASVIDSPKQGGVE